MRFKYKMPDLSETASDFDIVAWAVEEGARVSEESPLLEVSSDKATMEVLSPVTGRVIRHLVAVGDTIQAGTPIAEMETD